MKKPLLIGATLLVVLSLTGCACERITNIFIGGQSSVKENQEESKEKEYKYDEFLILIADAKFSFDYKKCTENLDNNGEKSTRVYTYDKENNNWYYLDEINNTKITTDLDIKIFLRQCKDIATGIGQEIDDAFKFSASSERYLINSHFSHSSKQVDGQYEFNSCGLMTLFDTKETDLDSIESTTYKAIYTYYK